MLLCEAAFQSALHSPGFSITSLGVTNTVHDWSVLLNSTLTSAAGGVLQIEILHRREVRSCRRRDRKPCS